MSSGARIGFYPGEGGEAIGNASGKSDPWHRFTLGGVWADPVTWQPIQHVSTGLALLDKAMGGQGLECGGCHLVVGRPGRAKTQVAVQIAVNAARAGVPVGFVSLELDRKRLGQLIAAQLSSVPRAWIAKGEVRAPADEKLRITIEANKDIPLIALDDDYWGEPLTRKGLARIAGEGVKRFGWKLVVVDYLGLVAAEEHDPSDYATDVANSSAMKRIARKQDVALMVVAALRKGGKKAADTVPATLDDVSGAGRICCDATNVMFVDCEQVEEPADPWPIGLVRIHPLKTRYSAAGSRGDVLALRWRPSWGEVCDMNDEDRDDTAGVA